MEVRGIRGVSKGFLEEVALSLQIRAWHRAGATLQLLTFRRDPLPSPRL